MTRDRHRGRDRRPAASRARAREEILVERVRLVVAPAARLRLRHEARALIDGIGELGDAAHLEAGDVGVDVIDERGPPGAARDGETARGKSQTKVGSHSVGSTRCSHSSCTIFPGPTRVHADTAAFGEGREVGTIQRDLLPNRLRERAEHRDPPPGRTDVELPALVVEPQRASNLHRRRADQVLDEGHHPLVVGIGLVDLHHRRPGRGCGRFPRCGSCARSRRHARGRRPAGASGTAPARSAGTGRRPAPRCATKGFASAPPACACSTGVSTSANPCSSKCRRNAFSTPARADHRRSRLEVGRELEVALALLEGPGTFRPCHFSGNGRSDLVSITLLFLPGSTARLSWSSSRGRARRRCRRGRRPRATRTRPRPSRLAYRRAGCRRSDRGA